MAKNKDVLHVVLQTCHIQDLSLISPKIYQEENIKQDLLSWMLVFKKQHTGKRHQHTQHRTTCVQEYLTKTT